MANSRKLSQIIMDNPIITDESIRADSVMKNIPGMVKSIIEERYPSLNFSFERNLYKTSILKKLSTYYNDLNIGCNLSNNNSRIHPDAGFIYLHNFDNSEKFLIVSGEAKVQGTNEKRQREGKARQSMGNAIERAHKNFNEIAQFMCDEKITPYIIFASGCDFEDGSSIRDRLSAITYGANYNRIYFLDLERNNTFLKRGSVFVRKEPWEETEIVDIIIQAASLAIEYYIEKYGIDYFNRE